MNHWVVPLHHRTLLCLMKHPLCWYHLLVMENCSRLHICDMVWSRVIKLLFSVQFSWCSSWCVVLSSFRHETVYGIYYCLTPFGFLQESFLHWDRLRFASASFWVASTSFLSQTSFAMSNSFPSFLSWVTGVDNFGLDWKMENELSGLSEEYVGSSWTEVLEEREVVSSSYSKLYLSCRIWSRVESISFCC